MIGGGVPKNFTQDIVVAAEVLGHDAPMHKYAVQITVADVRDGALSSSTLKEASSWGKVDTVLRADGLQRSDARDAADRRLRLSQRRLEGTKREKVEPTARAGRISCIRDL